MPFICHPDFANEVPRAVFHKEMEPVDCTEKDPRFLNRHVLFRKKIRIPHFSRAILNVTADDYYKLYINGCYVAQGPAASYPHTYYYNTLDVTPFLREGENTLALHTYYQGLINRVWVSGDRRGGMWCTLEVDGKPILESDTSWRCHDHTGYTACGKVGYDTAFLERYDSNAPEVGFFEESFDDCAWEMAAILSASDHCLTPQPTKPLVLYDLLPATLERTERGYRLDFGREAVGYLHAVVRGKPRERIILRFAEELDENGELRYQMRCNCCYEEEWILSGRRDTLMQYDYKGFRYAELICSAELEVEELCMRVRHYPYREKAVYSTQNADLCRVLQLCADTVRYGTQEQYVDCPTREKGQYLGDVSIAARAHAVLTGDTTMMKKAIRDFFQSSFICRGIMAVSGSSLMQEIADYSLQLPAQVCWVYAMDGDRVFLQEAEPYLTALYRYFLQYTDADGLLDGVTEKWNLVDWPKNLRDGYGFPLTKPIQTGAHNVLNAFWCGFLEAMDECYCLLGKEETGRTLETKEAFIRAFYDAERGLFCDSKQHTHAAVHSNLLPLLFSIGTEDAERKERMIAFLLEKRLTSMGVYMAYFALAALVKHGRVEDAERLATDPNCWLNMLAQGGTTTFEAWGKEQKKNCSLFHPWATAPLIVFAKDIRVY